MKYAQHDFDMALTEYMDAIKNDYVRWWGPKASEPITAQMINEFAVSAERGRNYLKIIHASKSQRSVHSFIVIKATKGFQVGDVLKAASWSAPATNFARASVFDTDTWTNKVRWAGVA